jgi:hypothetical protein
VPGGQGEQEVEPGDWEKDPTGQSEQRLPAEEEYWPAGHRLQDEAPLPLLLPAAQFAQDVDLAAEANVPSKHGEHEAEEVEDEKVPAAQFEQDVAPAVENIPTAHAVQDVAPVPAFAVPAGQLWQGDATLGLKVPAGHAEHDAEAWLLDRPAGHAKQLLPEA